MWKNKRIRIIPRQQQSTRNNDTTNNLDDHDDHDSLGSDRRLPSRSNGGGFFVANLGSIGNTKKNHRRRRVVVIRSKTSQPQQRQRRHRSRSRPLLPVQEVVSAAISSPIAANRSRNPGISPRNRRNVPSPSLETIAQQDDERNNNENEEKMQEEEKEEEEDENTIKTGFQQQSNAVEQDDSSSSCISLTSYRRRRPPPPRMFDNQQQQQQQQKQRQELLQALSLHDWGHNGRHGTLSSSSSSLSSYSWLQQCVYHEILAVDRNNNSKRKIKTAQSFPRALMDALVEKHVNSWWRWNFRRGGILIMVLSLLGEPPRSALAAAWYFVLALGLCCAIVAGGLLLVTRCHWTQLSSLTKRSKDPIQGLLQGILQWESVLQAAYVLTVGAMILLGVAVNVLVHDFYSDLATSLSCFRSTTTRTCNVNGAYIFMAIAVNLVSILGLCWTVYVWLAVKRSQRQLLFRTRKRSTCRTQETDNQQQQHHCNDDIENIINNGDESSSFSSTLSSLGASRSGDGQARGRRRIPPTSINDKESLAFSSPSNKKKNHRNHLKNMPATRTPDTVSSMTPIQEEGDDDEENEADDARATKRLGSSSSSPFRPTSLQFEEPIIENTGSIRNKPERNTDPLLSRQLVATPTSNRLLTAVSLDSVEEDEKIITFDDAERKSRTDAFATEMDLDEEEELKEGIFESFSTKDNNDNSPPTEKKTMEVISPSHLAPAPRIYHSEEPFMDDNGEDNFAPALGIEKDESEFEHDRNPSATATPASFEGVFDEEVWDPFLAVMATTPKVSTTRDDTLKSKGSPSPVVTLAPPDESALTTKQDDAKHDALMEVSPTPILEEKSTTLESEIPPAVPAVQAKVPIPTTTTNTNNSRAREDAPESKIAPRPSPTILATPLYSRPIPLYSDPIATDDEDNNPLSASPVITDENDDDATIDEGQESALLPLLPSERVEEENTLFDPMTAKIIDDDQPQLSPFMPTIITGSMLTPSDEDTEEEGHEE